MVRVRRRGAHERDDQSADEYAGEKRDQRFHNGQRIPAPRRHSAAACERTSLRFIRIRSPTPAGALPWCVARAQAAPGPTTRTPLRKLDGAHAVGETGADEKAL